MVLEGARFYAALHLIPNETVSAEFLDYASGSVTLVGLAATMSSLMFYVGRFVCGLFLRRIEKQRPFCRKWRLLVAVCRRCDRSRRVRHHSGGDHRRPCVYISLLYVQEQSLAGGA
jgi:hypothetical protein